MTREQIEAWRKWFKTGETSTEYTGTYDELCDMALNGIAPPEAEALLREIDESGVLYAHNLDLDAKVANFLSSRRPQHCPTNETKFQEPK